MCRVQARHLWSRLLLMMLLVGAGADDVAYSITACRCTATIRHYVHRYVHESSLRTLRRKETPWFVAISFVARWEITLSTDARLTGLSCESYAYVLHSEPNIKCFLVLSIVPATFWQPENWLSHLSTPLSQWNVVSLSRTTRKTEILRLPSLSCRVCWCEKALV